MQTVSDIDQDLLDEARRATGIEDIEELLNAGLRLLVKTKQQEAALDLRGTIDWQGDLKAWRRDREIENARR
ncbi:MAG: type II toxin-antitoxin system VapB family antitoxin [Armatimonadota bacterium]